MTILTHPAGGPAGSSKAAPAPRGLDGLTPSDLTPEARRHFGISDGARKGVVVSRQRARLRRRVRQGARPCVAHLAPARSDGVRGRQALSGHPLKFSVRTRARARARRPAQGLLFAALSQLD
jgi:hypothetical protein